MKCRALCCRFFRSRLCTYIVLIVCIFILCRVYQNRHSESWKSIFKRFTYNSGHGLFFHGYLSTNTTRFTPGIFLKNMKPNNESYCKFRLRINDYFEVPDSDVSYSPEMGAVSTYRVVYNVIQGENVFHVNKTITYCSHFTPEFIYYLVEIVVRWEGPISVSVFVPSSDASLTMCLLRRLCRCLPEMSKVSLHFVFPVEYPPDFAPCDLSLIMPPGCSVPNVMLEKKLETFRNKEMLVYPVNIARNVARVSARTTYVLVSDIELMPSKQLNSRFFTMLSKLHDRHVNDFRAALKHFVYVVPVFEVDSDVAIIPEVKSQLLDLYAQSKAIYFHRWVCLHCQRFPGLQRWIQRRHSAVDNSIQPLLIVRREFPYHRWEPIYIGTNKEPLYNELLVWEGQQDKMAQMYEMCLLGYKFVILDGAFLVHAPGIKRRTSTKSGDSSSNIRTVHHYQNMHHYDNIIRRVTKLHGIKQQCRVH